MVFSFKKLLLFDIKMTNDGTWGKFQDNYHPIP